MSLTTAPAPVFSTLPDLDLESAINSALERIPPLWPLKHFVAVNPFVGLADQPFSKACALLQRVVGAAPLQPPADYFRAFQEGRIRPQDLAAAADDDWTVDRLMAALEGADGERPAPTCSTVADFLDEEHPRAHWSVFVVEEFPGGVRSRSTKTRRRGILRGKPPDCFGVGVKARRETATPRPLG